MITSALVKLDFVLKGIHITLIVGAVVMEGYYIYFDRQNSSILFGATTCSPRVTNATRSTISGYSPTSYSLDSCIYKSTTNDKLPTFAIILIALGAFILTIVLVLLAVKLMQKWKKRRRILRADMDFDELMNDSFGTEY